MGPCSGLAHHCPTQAVYSQGCGKVIGQGLPFPGPCSTMEAISAMEGAGLRLPAHNLFPHPPAFPFCLLTMELVPISDSYCLSKGSWRRFTRHALIGTQLSKDPVLTFVLTWRHLEACRVLAPNIIPLFLETADMTPFCLGRARRGCC